MSYSATIITSAPPERVLAVLTDPDEIRTWSPVPFELERDGERDLRAGREARVRGSLAGLRVGFDVHVHAADERGLRLSASGPISLDVDYGLRPVGAGSELRARVSMGRAQGIGGRVVSKATETLLTGGALELAASRIARAAEGAGALGAAA